MAALRVVANWVKSRICQPSPHVGRTGAVCPFVPRSLERNLFWLGVQRTRDIPFEQLLDQILAAGEAFRNLKPVLGPHSLLRGVVLVLPDVTVEEAPELVMRLHTKLKPHFVGAGSMIGEFWPTCEQPGRHSASFRPLQSPIPLFVIRDMVLDDIAHLRMERRFVEAYLRKHERRGGNEIFAYINRGELFPPTPEEVAVMLDLVNALDPQLSRTSRRIDALTGLAMANALSVPPCGDGSVRIRVESFAETEARYGRAAADFLFWSVGQAIRKELAVGDLAVRMGGADLAVFAERGRAKELADRIRERLKGTVPRYHDTSLELVATIECRELESIVIRRITTGMASVQGHIDQAP